MFQNPEANTILYFVLYFFIVFYYSFKHQQVFQYFNARLLKPSQKTGLKILSLLFSVFLPTIPFTFHEFFWRQELQHTTIQMILINFGCYFSAIILAVMLKSQKNK